MTESLAEESLMFISSSVVLSCIWSWPPTSMFIRAEYRPPSRPECNRKLPDPSPCSCLKQLGIMSRVSPSFVLWHPAGSDRVLTQHSEAAAARSWFKPPPNQGSTFISRCHYSPAAVWQMALWDIGFYGRSSFISNFFSHLMRSSHSSQIHFAVWILIGLCTPSFSHPPPPLYHSLSFFTACESLKT